MLTWQKYDVAVDIWSAGCIFAEMLEGKPLFPGKDRMLLSYLVLGVASLNLEYLDRAARRTSILDNYGTAGHTS